MDKLTREELLELQLHHERAGRAADNAAAYERLLVGKYGPFTKVASDGTLIREEPPAP